MRGTCVLGCQLQLGAAGLAQRQYQGFPVAQSLRSSVHLLPSPARISLIRVFHSNHIQALAFVFSFVTG